ncbi:MAG: DUF1080 domain-containing protein [Pseudomonadota bacterium]|nr:MAG: DUF1080 domain-containing protein [Pseudomonadota bacterium]
MFEPLHAEAWRAYRGSEFPSASWTCDGDVIRAIPDGPRIDLITRERYGDFILQFEWCLPEGGNSGVLYRVSEDYEEAWQSGPEMQLVDDPRHPEGSNQKTGCGALHDLLPCSLMEPIPPNMYAGAKLVVRGTRVEHWIANQQVLAYDLGDPVLRRHIAESRLKDCPAFGALPEGHIVLRHQGTGASFRNLRIRRLD